MVGGMVSEFESSSRNDTRNYHFLSQSSMGERVWDTVMARNETELATLLREAVRSDLEYEREVKWRTGMDLPLTYSIFFRG
jgi:hypothetical protein